MQKKSTVPPQETQSGETGNSIDLQPNEGITDTEDSTGTTDESTPPLINDGEVVGENTGETTTQPTDTQEPVTEEQPEQSTI